MATFTEAQVADIAVILGTNSDVMDDHLDYYESLITESDKTIIVAQIARYNNGTVTGRVWFEGTESNEGFNMSAIVAAANRDPRAVIAGLIQWPWSGGGQGSLVRG